MKQISDFVPYGCFKHDKQVVVNYFGLPRNATIFCQTPFVTVSKMRLSCFGGHLKIQC